MIYYTVRPSGIGAWYPRAYTIEEALEAQVKEFTERFQALNPPPIPGTFPIKLKQVIDTMESNRWPCIGGPMDGEGIAKEIALNKGAGGKKLTVSFEPAQLVKVQSKDETIDGYYYFADDHYEWEDNGRIIETVIDPWINQEEKKAFEESMEKGK